LVVVISVELNYCSWRFRRRIIYGFPWQGLHGSKQRV